MVEEILFLIYFFFFVAVGVQVCSEFVHADSLSVAAERGSPPATARRRVFLLLTSRCRDVCVLRLWCVLVSLFYPVPRWYGIRRVVL